MEALAMMEPETFKKDRVSHDDGDPYQAYRNYQVTLEGLTLFYETLHGADMNSDSASGTHTFHALAVLSQKL